MKRKIVKYNLIPMLVFFVLSMLYNIGAFLDCIIMEIRFQLGDYAYKTTDLSGDFLQELYGEEWSLGYMLLAFFALSLIAVITILFYKKRLSKISYLLLGLSAIPSIFISVIFISEDVFSLTVGLIIEVIYMFFTLFFTIKDFKNWEEEQNDTRVSAEGVSIKNKSSIFAVLTLFSVGSIYFLGRILLWCDAIPLLETIYNSELFVGFFHVGFFVAEALLIISALILILFCKDKLSHATSSMLLLGMVVPIWFLISLIGSPSNEKVIITFAVYAVFVIASFILTVRDIKKIGKPSD